MIKVAFFDFDSTLYSHFENKIPDSAVKGINLLHKNGIKVFICSGRSLCEMDYFDTSMIKIDGMIANNGQVAYDENNNIIFEHPITGKLEELIVNIFIENKLPTYLLTGDRMFINFTDDCVKETQISINSPVPEIKKYEGEKFYMCSVFKNENIDEWNKLDQLKEYANITSWHERAIDIVPKNVTKADGIKEILDIYNIKPKETIAFGDSDNDIDMLKFCNIGVAMGNSTEAVLKSADYITDHIDKDGLYNALKHFQLI